MKNTGFSHHIPGPHEHDHAENRQNRGREHTPEGAQPVRGALRMVAVIFFRQGHGRNSTRLSGRYACTQQFEVLEKMNFLTQSRKERKGETNHLLGGKLRNLSLSACD